MLHELKLTQPYFDDVAKGDKSFEVRRFDRPFKVGDYLALNEYVDGKYTGRFMVAQIKNILREIGLLEEYCVLGIVPCRLYAAPGIFDYSFESKALISSYEVYGGEDDQNETV